MSAFLQRFKNLGSITEVETRKSFSGADLLAQVHQRADQLRKLGVSDQDRVLMTNGNSIAFFCDLLALWSINACAVPIDKSNPETEINSLAVHCNAKFHIGRDSSIKRFTSKVETTKSFGHLILYTSGTSGVPKAVLHSFETLEEKLKSLEKAIPSIEIQRSLCLLPTCFGHGLIGNSLFPLLSGNHLFIAESFEAITLKNLSRIIDRDEISFLSSVPSIWRLLAGTSGPQKMSLKRVHCASATFSEDLFPLIKSFAPAARIFNVYGLTEFASWISGHEIKNTLESKYVGTGWGSEIQVTNCDPVGVGEVQIKSSSLMHGYLNNESLTSEKVKDGWFNTGDLGILTKDFGLKVCGRSDEVINKGGMKIMPDEVNTVLLRHPSVQAAAVFSIPDLRLGEKIVAAFKANEDLSIAELESWCRDYLPAYRVPNEWLKLAEIPITSRGKTNIPKLCKMFLNLPLKNDGTGQFDRFDHIFRDVLNLGLSTDLEGISKQNTSNWDSIRHIDLFIKLKTRLNVTFTVEEITSIDTYQSLRAIFLRKSAEGVMKNSALK